MPPRLTPLLKAHEQLYRAVNRCHRPGPFPSDRHSVEYLFALYEQLIAPLVATSKPAREGAEGTAVIVIRRCDSLE